MLSAQLMFSSLPIFIHRHFSFYSKFLILIFLLNLITITNTYAHSENQRWKRAIGGESLDTSNFVLYIDEATGFKYIEVPYEYMQQWLNDQRMWRTVLDHRFSSLILCFVFSSGRLS